MSREPRTIRLRTVVVVGATLAVGFFAGIVAVRAVPGGPTRDALSFAGTLRQNGQPMMGQQSLTFTFKKLGISVCAPVVMATPDAATGNFSVEIPIDKCPASLFDGGDVVFDLSVGGVVIAGNQAVNAVPYAKYADKVGTPDCPLGYARDPAEMKYVLCRRGVDEVVKVANGGEPLWIDRFEATLWEKADGTGQQYGLFIDDADIAGFRKAGQWTTPLYAVSKSGARPATLITWHQADQACVLSGKRLPTETEWMRAAWGTVDPGAHNGGGGACLTSGAALRNTGGGGTCVSASGAQDLIGNVDEWTATLDRDTNFNPNQNYNGDNVPNIWSHLRGGYYTSGTRAGIFTLEAAILLNWGDHTGFRCAVSR